MPSELFKLCVYATLGEIYGHIRIISVLYNPIFKSIKLKVYLDRDPTDYDIDAAREISSYLADDERIDKYADYIEEECLFLKRTYKETDIAGEKIYARKEYDLEKK